MTTPFNTLSSGVGNQTDVRANLILKQLEESAKTFGREEWSIFEIFTLAIKTVEMGITHAKEHKVGYPKSLEVTAQDGSRITFTVTPPQSKAQVEMDGVHSLHKKH